MLWDTMIEYLKSWFNYSGLAWHLILIGIGLAIVFGAIWLCAHWPPLFKRPWFWAVAVVSAFLTLLAITFIQIPLQHWGGQALEHFFSQDTLTDWLMLVGIPMVLISGLVQEGAKMVPVVFWWWRSGKNITPKMGLAIGAIAGVGYALFEATWSNGRVFMSGWTWETVSFYGYQALLPFWERFWMIAAHIGISALAGYGLAKGRGWQFYLIAVLLHSAVNYIVVPFSKGMLTLNQIEIYLAAAAALITLAALWLRWRKKEEEAAVPLEPPGPDKPVEIDV